MRSPHQMYRYQMVLRHDLLAGDYILAVSHHTLSVSEAVSGKNNNDTNFGEGAYTILMQTLGGTWRSSESDI